MAPRERKREKKILVSDVIEHCISFVVKGKVVETARTHEQTIKKKKKLPTSSRYIEVVARRKDNVRCRCRPVLALSQIERKKSLSFFLKKKMAIDGQKERERGAQGQTNSLTF